MVKSNKSTAYSPKIHTHYTAKKNLGSALNKKKQSFINKTSSFIKVNQSTAYDDISKKTVYSKSSVDIDISNISNMINQIYQNRQCFYRGSD